MAIQRPKKGTKSSKRLVEPEPEPVDFEDEDGNLVDIETSSVDTEDEDEENETGGNAEDEEIELEVEPAKVTRVKKDGFFVALRVVRVNAAAVPLKDKSHHMGDTFYVGGPPFQITDQERAKELLRLKAIRPATERDFRLAAKAAQQARVA